MKKELVYIVPFSPTIVCGIQKKIANQVAAFKNSGWVVKVLRPKSGRKIGWLFETTVRGIGASFFSENYYIRHSVYSTPLVFWLKLLKKNIVLEVNGNLVAEVSGRKKSIQRACDKWAFKYVTEIVAVSEDVAQYVRAYLPSSNQAKVCVIPNAVEAVSHFISGEGKEWPTLIYVGSMQPFHGIDKLLGLLAQEPLKNVRLLCYGQGPCEKEWEELSKELGLSNRVFLTRWTEGNALQEAMAKADVGVGSLALERVGLVKGSPLKTREYVSSGLPVLIGYEETGSLANKEFIKQVNCNGPSAAKEIADFLDYAQRKGDSLRKQVWEFAKKELTFTAWAEKTLSLFR